MLNIIHSIVQHNIHTYRNIPVSNKFFLQVKINHISHHSDGAFVLSLEVDANKVVYQRSRVSRLS